MCGIAGFVNPHYHKPSLSLLSRMSQTLTHRGPDDHGEKIIDHVALANRRLAIIDLSSAGHMPMTNLRRSAWITYNGEIYNFQKLRQDLIKKGYKFHSQSDTEVVLNLYEAYGIEAFRKLDGMFAVAIWDIKKKQLVLARDHFGIKPLHYYYHNNLFIFASEIKAILAHPQVKKELNLSALSQYFSIGFGAIPSPNTIFQNIKKLPPAHLAIFKKGKLTLKRYWSLAKVSPSRISFMEAKEQLLHLLTSSVQRQLVSDVPLGGFLSGGVDSSTVVALMKQYHGQKVKTFSIGFSDPDFDESGYSRDAAKVLDTQHYIKTFKIDELLEVLPQVIGKLDEPLADASILPTYLLAHFTRQHVTVALSGDGGDELFAGYPTYLAHKFSGLAKVLPKSLLSALIPFLSRAARMLPIMKHSPNLSTEYKVKRFVSGLDDNLAKQYLNFMGPINLATKAQLLNFSPNNSDIDPGVEFIEQLLHQAQDFDKQKQLQYLDFMAYLSEDCLVKTDRASSFNSLEVRVPFLSPEIVEFCFSLPSIYHLKNLTLKFLFKQTVKDLLPARIVNRPKKGFGIPVHKWLKNELKPIVVEYLNKSRLEKQGLFNPLLIQQVINEHQSGKEDQRTFLWSLLIFQLWYDKWLK